MLPIARILYEHSRTTHPPRVRVSMWIEKSKSTWSSRNQPAPKSLATDSYRRAESSSPAEVLESSSSGVVPESSSSKSSNEGIAPEQGRTQSMSSQWARPQVPLLRQV